ncbi:MAG: LlaJI family restriction endonuclease [Muribaculum sp.]|nr:LlaJI family restriction endonuclease [Muribaculum sp.]
MKLLIEDHKYREEDVTIEGVRIFPFEAANDGYVKHSQVGYFFNSELKKPDCVFMLPKVILNEQGEVFGEYSPETLIDIDASLNEKKISQEQRDFLYSFSVWIFRAIAEFRRLNKDTTITRQESIAAVDKTHRSIEGTWLELMLAILKCCDDNRDFFMFIMKNIHSGYNRINWRKTISSQTAWLSNGKPMYLDLVNRKKQINFDEELLIIFFSIVRHICDTYGFKATINCNYDLITGSRFEQYLNGYGCTRLRQIKYKYFTDKAIEIWSLCYDFFDRASQIHSSKERKEYLFATSFENVFEAMVDELIGDKNLPSGLKEQKDGKILDHIYPYAALVNPVNDIYHIADSKYYKTDSKTQGESHFKQFTYAKNVIQYNLDILLNGSRSKREWALPYRDEITEGYNITPNFFISAKIDGDRLGEYNVSHLRHIDDDSSRHFENRLFDRDTLWLSHFSVNFLYILSLYAAANESAKKLFKDAARARFRVAIIKLLNSKYELFRFTGSPEDIEPFVNAHFRELNGKLFHFNDTLLMALEKDGEKSVEYQEQFSELFTIYQLS